MDPNERHRLAAALSKRAAELTGQPVASFGAFPTPLVLELRERDYDTWIRFVLGPEFSASSSSADQEL
jgi:hypothetical protein